MQRRQFVRLGLAGTALVPELALGGAPGYEQLQWLQITHDLVWPLAGPGDWLGIDAKADTWNGDGYYLYPAWGEPRPYQVRALACADSGEAGLAFCDPATGKVLWTDTRHARFAGRVRESLPALIAHRLGRRPDLPMLLVPRLPA